MNHTRHILCGLLVTAAMAGCQRTQVDSPLLTDYPVEDEAARMAYWHGLAERPLVSNDEALHGLIVLIRGDDPTRNFEQRVQWLAERDYIDAGFGRPPNESVERGMIAGVIAQVLDIQGGLTMRLVGPHPRYATRELVYLDIMEPGTSQQGMSGIEFVGLIAEAEQRLQDERDVP